MEQQQYSDLPEGATVESAPSGQQYSDLPPGATVEQPQQPPQQNEPGFISRALDTAGAAMANTAIGVGKLADKTPVVGPALNYASEKVGDALGLPKLGHEEGKSQNAVALEGIDKQEHISDRTHKGQEASLFSAEGLGYGSEKLFEFMSMDGAFKALGIAERTAQLAKAMKFFEANPGLYKMFQAALAKPKEQQEALTLLQKFGAGAIHRVAEAMELGSVGAAQELTSNPDAGVKHALGVGAETGVAGAAVGGTLDAAGGLLKNVVKGAKGETASAARASLQKVADKGAALADAPKDLVDRASGWMEDRENLMHDKFQQGVDDIKEKIPSSMPYETTPLFQKTKELLGRKEIADPFDVAEKKAAPVSKEAKDLLENYREIGEPEPIKPTPENPNPTQPTTPFMDVDSLMKRRSSLAELRRTAFRKGNTEDARLYGELLNSVDDSINELAKAPDADPSAVGQYQNIRNEYKNSINLFKNPVVDALRKGDINDVSDKLLKGEKSIENIRAVRALIGDDKMEELSSDIIKQHVALANGNPTNVLKWYQTISKNGKNNQVLDELFSLRPPKNDTQYFHDALQQMQPGKTMNDLTPQEFSQVNLKAQEFKKAGEQRASKLVDLGNVVEEASKSARVQRMFKVIGFGAKIGTGAEAIAMGVAAHHPLLTILGGAILAGGSKFGLQTIEDLSDHPALWKGLGLLEKVTPSAEHAGAAMQKAANPAQKATSALTSIYSGAKGTLGGYQQ